VELREGLRGGGTDRFFLPIHATFTLTTTAIIMKNP